MGDSARFEAVLAAIASTRSWRAAPPLAATVVTTTADGGVQTSLAKVDLARNTWSLAEGKTGSSFDPVDGLMFYSPMGEERAGFDRADWMPLQILLFRPMQMRIWGGQYDEMRVVDASEARDSFTLTLEHQEDRSPGTAVIGKEFGVVTEFSYVGTKVVLENLHTDYADGP